jgi:hypothetical protein
MEEKKSQIGLYIAIIALLVGVANIFLGVLPTVELKGKAEQLEARVSKAEKTADAAKIKLKEMEKRQVGYGAVAPMPPAPAPLPPPAPPLPPGK